MKNTLTANRLNEALHDANMTAQELSNKSGVSKNSISQYRNGVFKPSPVSSAAIGRVLGVNSLWLMGYDVAKEELPIVKKTKDYNFIFNYIGKADSKTLSEIRRYIEFVIERR